MNDLTFKKYCLTFLLVKEKKNPGRFVLCYAMKGSGCTLRFKNWWIFMGIPQCWRIYHLLSQTSVLLTFKFVFYIPLWGTLKLLYHLSNTRPENVAVLLSCANVRGKKNSALDTMPHTFTGGISFQPGAIAFETGRRAQRLHRIANSRLEPARNSPDIIAIGDNSWKGSHVSCLESPHSWTSFYF